MFSSATFWHSLFSIKHVIGEGCTFEGIVITDSKPACAMDVVISNILSLSKSFIFNLMNENSTICSCEKLNLSDETFYIRKILFTYTTELSYNLIWFFPCQIYSTNWTALNSTEVLVGVRLGLQCFMVYNIRLYSFLCILNVTSRREK